LTAYRIEPRRAIATDKESISTFRAIATFNDGSEEDVTAWTIFTPTASAMVTIDQAPIDQETIEQETAHRLTVHADRPGRHVIMAQFLDQVAAIEVIVPFGHAPIETTGLHRANFIDDEILETLTPLRIPISPRADNSTLLRRVYLDLIGRLPSPLELEQFESNLSANTYEQEVERLLASDAFVDYWMLKFARWLRIHKLPGDSQSTVAYVDWIHDSIKDGVGIDVMARQLVSSPYT